ncbi:MULTISPECIES: FtsB family cell division protein [Carnobacterium]|jgi:cell division protein DivIC|uniref:Septum formation initiator family protein n=1 Tax=Carnobacterium maltaromaticum LMA28 TaxID=1234679 RepID=K8EN90_CARML|nr:MULTISPECIES: septum formation initiator family protein [Carnobacterium]AOA03858.1 cell-division initiation protein [Carnobacterium maltaromaticum]KRN63544.1 hypothetical protein IV70_GL003242 [Carnobacterium maltaromaticum DSM 20342]KRN72560.1 hypothetical protein IV76_GL002309 [Carnobacterium maltaromaticum]KRN84892.1 hypothetical protein IV75_GL000136 [Carnobacterium maltaromaticum]MBC9787577.1 cell-division initiation protein [Carnobacterium maltaromaticum]
MNKKRGAMNVTSLGNEYTQEKNLQSHREKKHKRQTRRRLFAILFVGLLIIGGLGFKIMANQQALAKMKSEEVQVAKELKKANLDQRLLNNQIKQLKDDSYIEKLARAKYDLSKDNEIIFNLSGEATTKSLEESKKKIDADKKAETQESGKENEAPEPNS